MLIKAFGELNLCVLISKYLDKLSEEATGYTTIHWAFENVYARMLYPKDLKNKYLAFSLVTNAGKSFYHKLSNKDFEHFTNPSNALVPYNTYKDNFENFGQYCNNYTFNYDGIKYKYDVIIKGFATSKLPENSLQIVTDFFYAIASVENISDNIVGIQ